jgi:nitric oxide reductase activation protein
MRSAERSQTQQHVSRAEHHRVLVELAEGATTDETMEDPFSSPVGGGGAIGRWLAKLLAPVRQLRGGGSPGADAATHWTRTGRRGGSRAVFSTATTESVNESSFEDRDQGTKYPEWDVHGGRYRKDWCTVHEVETKPKDAARFAVPDRAGLRRSLARLGLGIDRYHRQAQGDDIDIDAVIEAHVAAMAGSAPDEAVFIDSVRRRRDLSVLLLLDVSGSAAEPAARGKTVHEAQRAAAAALMLALHELGDRVALYAFHSRGRSAVSLMPVKRFGEDPGALVLQRLGSLEPGAYSRLGAAIRHGTASLRDHGGTPRQLLVVLSDGLAYDHGYEPVYGAADARRALGEARRQGVGCLCLSVGAATDGETLRRVFGSSAHAALLAPEQLSQVLGPLFRSAIRSADVRRRVA